MRAWGTYQWITKPTHFVPSGTRCFPRQTVTHARIYIYIDNMHTHSTERDRGVLQRRCGAECPACEPQGRRHRPQPCEGKHRLYAGPVVCFYVYVCMYVLSACEPQGRRHRPQPREGKHCVYAGPVVCFYWYVFIYVCMYVFSACEP